MLRWKSRREEGEARKEDYEAANDQPFFAVRCNSNLPFKKEYNRGWMDTDVIFAKNPSLVLEEIKPPSIKRHIESKHFSVWELFEGVLFKVNNNSFFYSNCVFQQNMKQKEKRPEVQQVDLLFPSPSGSNLSQGQGKKRKVCYTIHILDTLFLGNNIHFSRMNPTANLHLESSIGIYF